MFDILIERLTHVFLNTVTKIIIRLIDNVKGSNFSYFTSPKDN